MMDQTDVAVFEIFISDSKARIVFHKRCLYWSALASGYGCLSVLSLDHAHWLGGLEVFVLLNAAGAGVCAVGGVIGLIYNGVSILNARRDLKSAEAARSRVLLDIATAPLRASSVSPKQ